MTCHANRPSHEGLFYIKETAMVETKVTGEMNAALMEDLQNVAQGFMGKPVKITIQELNGTERRPRAKDQQPER